MISRTAFPLSPAQSRLWFLEQLTPGTPAYNVPVAWRIRGDLSHATLSDALQAIWMRHEAPRARVQLVAGEPHQMVMPEGPPLEFLDFVGYDDAAACRQVGELARQPFELEGGPLARVHLLRLNSDDHVLLLTQHHLVTDGWSLGILGRELAELYRASRQRSPARLPEPVPYRRFVEQQRAASPEIIESDLAYWRQRLSGSTATELPTDKPRPAVVSYEGQRVEVDIRDALSRINAISTRLNATPFMFILSAVVVLLARYSGRQDIVLGTPVSGRLDPAFDNTAGLLTNTVALRLDARPRGSFVAHLRSVRDVVLEALEHQAVPFERLVDSLERERDASRNPLFGILVTMLEDLPLPLEGLEVEAIDVDTSTSKFDLGFTVVPQRGTVILTFRPSLFEPATVKRIGSHLANLVRAASLEPSRQVRDLTLLSDEETHLLLSGATLQPTPAISLLARLQAVVAENPERCAVKSRRATLSYAELDRRAAIVAGQLRHLGVSRGSVVGVCGPRSADLVVAILGILKAGAAYLPLDPAYPSDRLLFMLADADVSYLVSWGDGVNLPGFRGQVIVIDAEPHTLPVPETEFAQPEPADVAYVIYTSGSTGQPKGVVVTHGNLAALCADLDSRIPIRRAPVLLATTTISFDISVLELLWSLSRGFEVVLAEEPLDLLESQRRRVELGGPEFSLFYFANDDSTHAEGRYRLLIEGARFADAAGFSAVWTPERHFHPFGGMYPNPSVTAAALALITNRVQLRAGSVVLPLHDPIRVAEEWALVDNLSGGRTGISFASGWQPEDFVLSRHSYSQRRAVMRDDIETVRRLWRGETITRMGPNGPVAISTRPRPVQPELPVWITAARTPETFEFAGEIKANLLTHLLGQELDELKGKIELYRERSRRAGHQGHVTLMLHTFVGEDPAEVRDVVRGPFIRYLRSSLDLVGGLLRSVGGSDLGELTDEDLAPLLEQVFDRYYGSAGLLGTRKELVDRVSDLARLGVDEVACLIDFGIPDELVLRGLERLADLRDRSTTATDTVSAFAKMVESHRITHLQVTPTMARALVDDPANASALRSLDVLLVGGEAFPDDLAQRLRQLVPEVQNLYGPTETTVWSSGGTVSKVAADAGRPFSSERLYVLDRDALPTPIGVPGEVFIGGAGVALGYLDRPRLTADRFMPDAFAADGSRMYRTGDAAVWSAEGRLRILGRTDDQVKVRGRRIELGEIEVTLRSHPAVQDAAAVVENDRILAFVTLRKLAPLAPHGNRMTALPPGIEAIHLPNGLTIAHNSARHALAAYREVFEDDVYFRHGIALMRDRPTVIDVGANIGLFTLRCLAEYPTARILAIEPLPITHGALRLNLEVYDPSGAEGGVRSIQMGIGEAAGVADFVYYAHLPGLSRLARLDAQARDHALRVASRQALAAGVDWPEAEAVVKVQYAASTIACQVQSLSEVMAEHAIGKVDLLKIDVEGAEVDVLRGIASRDWPRIQQVAMEVHGAEQQSQVERILASHGYDVVFEPLEALDERALGMDVLMCYARRPEQGGVTREPVSVEDLLSSHLQERLPAYMVPARVTVVSEIPRTPNGKTDRAQLHAPIKSSARPADGPPIGDLEDLIASSWRDALESSTVDMDRTFFELGGNSMLLVKVHRDLRDSAKLPVTLADLFRFPTIRSLANHLTSYESDVAVRQTATSRGRLRRHRRIPRGRDESLS